MSIWQDIIAASKILWLMILRKVSPKSNPGDRQSQQWHNKKTENEYYLLWVTKTLFTWPSPLQPGKGQCGSSCLFSLQERGAPLRGFSFCLLAARGQPEAVRWDVYLPDMWPWPSHPITGHLETQRDIPSWERLATSRATLLLSEGGSGRATLTQKVSDEITWF